MKKSSYLRVKFLNYVWKLNHVRKIRLFAWKLIGRKIPNKDNLRKIGMNIDGNCLYYGN